MHDGLVLDLHNRLQREMSTQKTRASTAAPTTGLHATRKPLQTQTLSMTSVENTPRNNIHTNLNTLEHDKQDERRLETNPTTTEETPNSGPKTCPTTTEHG